MCGGKGSSGGSTQTATSTSAPPSSVTNAYNNITSLAEQAASAPLQQYSGPLLAGFTDMQNQGFNTINGTQNTLQPYLNTASNLVNQGTQNIYSQLPQYNAQNIQQYQNPYQQQVINATMAQANQQDQQQQQQLTGNAIAQGAWGGDRAAVAQGVLGGQQAMANNSTLAGLNSQGFTQAQNEFNTQQQTQLSALQNQAGLDLQGAGVQGYLGNAALQGQLGVGNAELTAGNQQQAQAQNALNIPYQQFEQQQAYPFQTTQYLANLLLNTANTQGGTSTTTQPSQTGNTAAQIAGLGLGVAGLFANKGGRINKYDAGGGVPDVDVNFIPLQAGMSPSGGGIPAPPKVNMPQQNNGMSSIMSGLGGLGGSLSGIFGGGSPTGTNFIGGAQDIDSGAASGINWNQASDQDIFSGAGMMPDDFRRGGNVYPNYATGGATVNVPQTANGPQTSFIDLGGATGKVPVYSFNSPGGTSNNNGYSTTIPNTLDYSKLKNFSLSSLATPSVAPSTTMNGASGTDNNPLTQSQFNTFLQNSPGYGLQQQWDMIQDPGAYNTDLARGGMVKRYDDGGNVTAPFSSYSGMNAGLPGANNNPLMQEMLMSQIMGNGGQQGMGGTQPIGVPNNSPNVAALNGASALSGVLGGASTGPTSGLGIPQAPSGGLNGLPAAPQISSSDDDDDDTAVAAPTGSKGLDLSKVDPGMALSEAGFAMAAAPGHNFLQNAAIGAEAGLSAYSKQKVAQVTADEKAEELAQKAEQLSQGRWQLAYTKDADGNLVPRAYDSKNNVWGDAPAGATLQGKGQTAPTSATANSDFGFADTGAQLNPKEIQAKQASDAKDRQNYEAAKPNIDAAMQTLNSFQNVQNSGQFTPGSGAGLRKMGDKALTMIQGDGSSASAAATAADTMDSLALKAVTNISAASDKTGSARLAALGNALVASKPGSGKQAQANTNIINGYKSDLMDYDLSQQARNKYAETNPRGIVDQNADDLYQTLKTIYPLQTSDKNGNITFNSGNVAKIQQAIPDAIKNPTKYADMAQKLSAASGATPAQGNQSSQPASKIDDMSYIQEARMAVKNGLPQQEALKRLQSVGIDPKIASGFLGTQ